MSARILGAVLALGFALTAAGVDAQTGSERDPVSVKVYQGDKSDRYVVVLEEPLITAATEKTLVWKLITPGYEFLSPYGIIEPTNAYNCSLRDKQTVQCIKVQPHVSHNKFPYTINVIDSKSGQRIPPADPIIFDY
jgi:hypothetical protein